MNRRMLRTTFALLLILTEAALAQDARLTGHVVDAESGAPLPGATIVIPSTLQGTQADLQGHYLLENLARGPREIEFQLLGYHVLTRQVHLTSGSNRLDVRLSPEPIHLGEMLVQADRPLSAASSRAIRDFDLQVRPKQTTQQMLQMAPGLIIAQHAGGGKAEQIYLRNFDTDHGTDVAILVDGLPVNLVSHGHGQGYADLHFLIPEVVEGLDVYKGPYFARFGNLATAGAVAFRTRSHLPENLLRIERGSFNTSRASLLYQLPLDDDDDNSAYFAGEFYRTDGPVDAPQGLRRLNVFAKYHSHLSERASLTIDAGGFTSVWDASGQIPQRAIDTGRIDRFGAIDPLEGGGTGRQNLNVTFRAHGRNNSDYTSRVYASWYDFKLFSNFTLFLEHPVEGDMIEQVDDRTLFGLDNTYRLYHEIAGVLAQSTFGGGLRADNVEVALWHAPDRLRHTALVDSRVAERNAYLWLQEEIFLGPQLRLVLGLRGDYFTFNVDDRLEGIPGQLPHASGVAQDEVLSPKAGLIYSPTTAVDLFLNAGSGFHSNDARAVVIDRRASLIARQMRANGATTEAIDEALIARHIEPDHLGAGLLPRAIGAEVGLRTRLGQRLNLGVACWWLQMAEEFVYVGDGGATEPSGRTRRLGIDVEARTQLLSWIWADVDATLSRGELTDAPAAANDIPLAPRFTSEGGLTTRHASGLEASLRYRFIGDRPANEEDTVTAQGHFLLNADIGYRLDHWRLQGSVENILDTEWNEAQFDTESRLPGEHESVSELHFTPGNPLGVRLGLSYLF
jgi:outer membrane receptor protein involved in Fe transport